MPESHLNFVAIVHARFYIDNRMENGLNTGQCSPTVNYLKTVEMLAQRVVDHEMCSRAKRKKKFKIQLGNCHKLSKRSFNSPL